VVRAWIRKPHFDAIHPQQTLRVQLLTHQLWISDQPITVRQGAIQSPLAGAETNCRPWTLTALSPALRENRGSTAWFSGQSSY
jgi:hypothetical protein